jgi:Fur family peroxide stress response transcriptional regulator
MRYSKQRDTIREIVCNSKSHPNADWIYGLTKKKIPKISLGTVYRNLKQLEKNGDIKAIYHGNSIRYDGNIKKHNHLRCLICDDLIDIKISHEGINKSITNKYKFKIDEIELTVIGRCEKHIDDN